MQFGSQIEKKLQWAIYTTKLKGMAVLCRDYLLNS